jgi:hypothetical protein
LCKNPNIMQIICFLDYEKMKKCCADFAKELAAYVYHPKRLQRISVMYNMTVLDMLDIY